VYVSAITLMFSQINNCFILLSRVQIYDEFCFQLSRCVWGLTLLATRLVVLQRAIDSLQMAEGIISTTTVSMHSFITHCRKCCVHEICSDVTLTAFCYMCISNGKHLQQSCVNIDRRNSEIDVGNFMSKFTNEIYFV
jgi:hypothetical protein